LHCGYGELSNLLTIDTKYVILVFILSIGINLQFTPTNAEPLDLIHQEPEPPFFSWQYIDSQYLIKDTYVNFTHSIIVEAGGSLSIINSSVNIASDRDGIHMIRVEAGGALTIVNSSYFSMDDIPFNITLYSGSYFNTINTLYIRNNATSADHLLHISTNNVTIDTCAFNNTHGVGVGIEDDVSELANITVRNCIFSGPMRYGLLVDGANDTNVDNCAFFNVSISCIYLSYINNANVSNIVAISSGVARFSSIVGLNLQNFSSYDSSYSGLMVVSCMGVLIERAVISNCLGSGIWVTQCYQVELYHSRLIDIGGTALYIEYTPNVTLRYNIINRCTQCMYFDLPDEFVIQWNIFGNYTLAMIQVISANSIILNSSQYGNYWIDYDGEDLDNDGVGDSRYGVAPGRYDYHPLMYPLFPEEIEAMLAQQEENTTSVTIPTFPEIPDNSTIPPSIDTTENPPNAFLWIWGIILAVEAAVGITILQRRRKSQ